MNEKRASMIAICQQFWQLAPAVSFAQGTTFSGEAIGLKASVVGVSLDLADTGALPSSGGNLNTSVATVNVAGIAAANTLSSSTSAAAVSRKRRSRM